MLDRLNEISLGAKEGLSNLLALSHQLCSHQPRLLPSLLVAPAAPFPGIATTQGRNIAQVGYATRDGDGLSEKHSRAEERPNRTGSRGIRSIIQLSITLGSGSTS